MNGRKAHEWQVSRFTETTTCSKCGLLPLDRDDVESSCPGSTTVEETP